VRASVPFLLVLLAAPTARADEPEPDPTVIRRVPASEDDDLRLDSDPAAARPGDTGDPCDRSPRCRLARFRAEQARVRRHEYLAALEREARAMDQRITRAMPWRTRYPVQVGFVFVTNGKSNLALPTILVGYSPTWWLRLSAQVGYFTHSNYITDETTSFNHDIDFKGLSLGSRVRFTPIKFALSPYADIGWTYASGRLQDNSYSGSNSYVDGDGEAHFATLGAGLSLVVPYFHVSLGYQLGQAFYAQGRVDGVHAKLLKDHLQTSLDETRHFAAVEFGCAF